jgi:hypothetical protein
MEHKLCENFTGYTLQEDEVEAKVIGPEHFQTYAQL